MELIKRKLGHLDLALVKNCMTTRYMCEKKKDKSMIFKELIYDSHI